jgi:hypothetical protein
MKEGRSYWPEGRWSLETNIDLSHNTDKGTLFELEVFKWFCERGSLTSPSETMASVLLPQYDRHAEIYHEIDILHINRHGLFCVELKNWGGSLLDSLDLKNDKIRIVYPDQTYEIRHNPVHQNQNKFESIKRHLGEFFPSEYYCPVYNRVIFSNNFNFNGILLPYSADVVVANFAMLQYANSYDNFFCNTPISEDMDICCIEALYEYFKYICPVDSDVRQSHRIYVEDLKVKHGEV